MPDTPPELVTKDGSLWIQRMETEFNTVSTLVEPKHPQRSVTIRILFMGDFMILDPFKSEEVQVRNEIYLLNKLLRFEMLTATQASPLKIDSLAQMAGWAEAEAFAIAQEFANDLPPEERKEVIDDLYARFLQSKQEAITRIIKMKSRRNNDNPDDEPESLIYGV